MKAKDVAQALASELYSEKACASLLRKKEGWKAASLLKDADPQSAMDLAIQIMESGTFHSKRPLLAQLEILDVPLYSYERLLHGPDRKLKKERIRPLVEWLELGRDEHLDFLRSELECTQPHLLCSAISPNPTQFPRMWALVEKVLGGDFMEKAPGFVSGAKINNANHLVMNAFAKREGVKIDGLGAMFFHGGRVDVSAHNIKQVVELLWRKDPETFFEHLEALKKASGIVGWNWPWMLSFLDPIIEMVNVEEGRTVLLLAERLVVTVSGNFQKTGRLYVKRHKTEDAAAKDYEKRVATAEEKLGGTRAPWDGVSSLSVAEAMAAGPFDALLEAARGDRLDDVEELLKRGVNPNDSRTDSWGNVRTPCSVEKLEEGKSL